MKRRGSSKSDKTYLKAFGANLETAIRAKGYVSLYDFWIRKVGDEIGRSTLGKIIGGQSDPSLTTVRMLAKMLKVPMKDLLDF